jgi:hypothetical protein
MHRAGLRVALLACLLAAAAPCVAQAAERPSVDVYRVAQNLTLDEGQSGDFTLACRHGDIAMDGTWRVDSVDTNPQIDDETFDLVSGIDVLAAEPFSRQAYRFSVRNTAEGDAAVRIAVSCLTGTIGRRTGVVRGRREVTAPLAAGSMATLPPVVCPPGTVVIAPGLRVQGGGAARLLGRMPTLPGLERSTFSVFALDDVTIVASARCLARQTANRQGRRYTLRMAFRAGDAQVDAGHVASFTVGCRGREAAIGSAFSLSAAWYLGQTPSGRQRAFRVQATADAAGAAELGLLCLRDRATVARR